MTRLDELIERMAPLQRADVEAWVKEGLVAPREEAGTLLFSEVECARIRLICTLRYDLEIDIETLPVIVSLVDQLYDTRQRLLSLTAAVAAQDKDVQAAILARMDPGGTTEDKE